jgi:polyhydroxyalkanoate synthesis regulator phasin
MERKSKEWFNEANQLFKEYVEEGDINTAKYVIQDMFDAGYPERAREMNEELRTATNV